MMGQDAKRSRRTNYRYFLTINTRWSDNDVYAHVNNVVYLSWFDTVVNQFLTERGVLDPAGSPVIGLVVENSCTYFAPISFPEKVHLGLGVGKIGNSSVRYEIGVFREGEDCASAQGYFVHVYVDRAQRRPVGIPAAMRMLLQSIEVRQE